MTTRPILQSEAVECGLTCVAMLANAHGLRIDLAELRQRFSISLKGADLAQLMRHAQALNFATPPLRLELDEMNRYIGSATSACFARYNKGISNFCE